MQLTGKMSKISINETFLWDATRKNMCIPICAYVFSKTIALLRRVE